MSLTLFFGCLLLMTTKDLLAIKGEDLQMIGSHLLEYRIDQSEEKALAPLLQELARCIQKAVQSHLLRRDLSPLLQ